MNEDLERYSCQLPLKGFGVNGQAKLKNAKVLIVGLGGLGCPASQYLAAAGIGTIGIADFDKISTKNLHRQTLYDEKDIGKLKTSVALSQLNKINKNIKIITYPEKITIENAKKIINNYDIVVDCTDNFETKYLLNDICVINQKPLVYGAISQYEGQVSVFNVKNKNNSFSSNYRDVFPSIEDVYIPNCETGGVIPTIAGIIGCIQANEVIKYFTGIGELLTNCLFIFDSRSIRSYIVSLPKKSTVNVIEPEINTKIPIITPEDLLSTFDKKYYELIDVRSEDEHKNENIGGKNIPLDKLIKDVDKIQINKPTVFYCRSGARSAVAVEKILKINPHAKILSLAGGIQAFNSISNS